MMRAYTAPCFGVFRRHGRWHNRVAHRMRQRTLHTKIGQSEIMASTRETCEII